MLLLKINRTSWSRQINDVNQITKQKTNDDRERRVCHPFSLPKMCPRRTVPVPAATNSDRIQTRFFENKIKYSK